MKPQTQSHNSNVDSVLKSITQVLRNNVAIATPTTFDADGYPLVFSVDNMVGEVIRIGSTANPNALPAAWPAALTDLTIAHNLGAIPWGILVLFKTAPADVFFGSIPPTDTQITLQTTNAATDTTIWIIK